MMMTMASEHAHDQVSKQTLKVVLLQLAVRLTGSVIQLVLIEVVVIGAARAFNFPEQSSSRVSIPARMKQCSFRTVGLTYSRRYRFSRTQEYEGEASEFFRVNSGM